jgi:hypothetical protein
MAKSSAPAICFISPFVTSLLKGETGAGGAERQFVLFGQGLQKREWQVSYIGAPIDSDVDPDMPLWEVPFYHLRKKRWLLPLDILCLWIAMFRSGADYFVLKMPDHLLLPIALFCCLFRRKTVFWGQAMSKARAQRNGVLDHVFRLGGAVGRSSVCPICRAGRVLSGALQMSGAGGEEYLAAAKGDL